MFDGNGFKPGRIPIGIRPSPRPIEPMPGVEAGVAIPSNWGSPPEIQTMDLQELPLGGRGSGTVRNWQLKKIQEFGWPPGSEKAKAKWEEFMNPNRRIPWQDWVKQ